MSKGTKRTAKKSAARSAEPPPLEAELIPQAHGGALLPGGQRGNAGGNGRPPNMLRELCREISDRMKLAEVVAKIAAGELGESYAAGDGKVLYTDTKNSDRVAAVKLLWAYGFGQPVQAVDLDPKDQGTFKVLFVREVARGDA